MTEKETDEISPDELQAELNEVHAGEADDADLEAALSNFLSEDDAEGEADDDTTGDDGRGGNITLKCQKCGEYVKREDIAAHYAECDE